MRSAYRLSARTAGALDRLRDLSGTELVEALGASNAGSQRTIATLLARTSTVTASAAPATSGCMRLSVRIAWMTAMVVFLRDRLIPGKG
jgi:hypothetical protein